MAEKTSIWIRKLSKDGKAAMHSFLVFFNTGNLDKNTFELTPTDTKALSVIVQRLQLQNSIQKINGAIEKFNESKNTNLDLIK